MESSNTFPPMGQSQVSDTNQSHIPHRYSHHSPPPPTHSHRHGDLPSILLIVLPIILFFLIVFLILLISLLPRQKPIKSHDNNNNIQIINGNSTKFISHTSITFPESPDMKNGCINVGSSRSIQESSRFRGVQVFTYKELEFATDNFSPANVVGDGGYGIVYRGVLRDGTVAAIKKLHRDGKHGERAFRVEVDLLSGLHSPYLVELLGYCADQTHRLLIFEFMPNGSLQQHLHSANNSTQSRPLDWATRLRIALDCARALEFLHEHVTPAVIHRDFKCSNILLDCNLRAKVSDFGLAKMGSDKMNGQISTRVLGTTGYLAPEYAKTGKLTTKSDVYSYGVVLLQLITGRVPIDTRRPPGEHVLVSWALPRLTSRQKVVEMVDPALKGQFSKKDIIQIAAIAAVCVQAEPEYRPLITDVVQSMIPLVKHLSSVPSSSSRFPSNNMVSPKIQRHSF